MNTKPKKRWFIFVVAILLIAAAICVYFFQTYHYAVVKPGILYRDGNRDIREFSNSCRRAGIRTVVSVIDNQELANPRKPQFRAEARYLASHGIRQVRIPVRLGGWPDTADVRAFLTVVHDPADRPVLVHCAQGVRRTGMFVAAYQMSVLGYTAEHAKLAVMMFGHSDATGRDIDRFIDAYNAKTRTVGLLPTRHPATTKASAFHG